MRADSRCILQFLEVYKDNLKSVYFSIYLLHSLKTIIMRKFLITIVVITLILSILGTGVVVLLETSSPSPSSNIVSGE